MAETDRTGAKPNEIETRIASLRDQWLEFSSDEKSRVLCWQITSDELPFIDAFLEVESHDALGATPDLFWRIPIDFHDETQYGAALSLALRELCESSREALASAGVTTVWAPPANVGTGTLEQVLSEADHFRAHCGSMLNVLALVLTPVRVADPVAWWRWLERFAFLAPAGVRAIILADLHATLPDVEPRSAALTQRRVAGLDAPAAMLGAARAAGRMNEPGGLFRMSFLELARAAGARDLAAARQAAEQCVRICRAQDWAHLLPAVHCALAGLQLALEQPASAAVEYSAAAEAARLAAERGEPHAARMQLAAGMGIGAARLQTGEHAGACEAYLECEKLACAIPDPSVRFESLRMAGYCQELAGDRESAWQHGTRALDVAESLDAESRAHLMLPYAGVALLRLVERSPDRRARDQIHAQLSKLIGRDDWKPSETPA